MRRGRQTPLPPLRDSSPLLMCQSLSSSVPRTYIRAADELEPFFSPAASGRLASLPSLSSSATTARLHHQVQQSPPLYDAHHHHNYQQHSGLSPLGQPPPKALPQALTKSLRPSKLPPKNLDEMAPLHHHQQQQQQQQTGEKPSPGTGLLGKCVLCLLLNAVFVLALFLAFLIGHFAAEAHLPYANRTTNSTTTAIAISPKNASSDASFSATAILHQQEQSESDEYSKQKQKSAQSSRGRQRIPSLREVYPPQLNADWDDGEEEGAIALLMMAQQSASQHSLANGPVVHRSQATAGAPRPDVPLIPLPRTVLPRHYNLELDLTEFYGIVEGPQVRGNQSILLEAFGNSTNDELVFHAAPNIFIQRIRLFRQVETGKAPMDVQSVRRDGERELVRLVLGERLKAGWYWLHMEFRTRICQSDFEGTHCFPSPLAGRTTADHFPPTNGAANQQQPTESKRRQLVAGFATKFEPNLARTFVPGWDEPRFRSTFNVSIRHFSDARVLTNTGPLNDIASSAGEPLLMGSGLIRTSHFATSPPMPLFLLAFATGSFSPLEVRTSRGNISVNVWAAPQDMLSAQFVANFSPTIFDRLLEDFGVKYPLPKMDIFITPKFPVGGMENWGLIVLQAETVRLSTGDSGSSSYPLSVHNGGGPSSAGSSSREEHIREQQQQSLLAVDRLAEQYRVEKAITHELIHQWFGNLVGIWDWEELWLSEGFASYFVFDFLNALKHPHLTEHEYYLRLIELIQHQSTDGRSALVRPIRGARQLDALFDGIQLYTKGAVIVKMLKDLVGPAEFRAGISRFLRENSFQSIERSALWTAFPTHADHGADPMRLKEAMEPWIVNRGLPELGVTRSYEDQTIRLEQRQADRNRHLVYLDDHAMQRVRLEMGEERRKRGRRRRRRRAAAGGGGGRMGDVQQQEGELYSEMERTARSRDDDIDTILHWMEEEMDDEGTTEAKAAQTSGAATDGTMRSSPLEAAEAGAADSMAAIQQKQKQQQREFEEIVSGNEREDRGKGMDGREQEQLLLEPIGEKRKGKASAQQHNSRPRWRMGRRKGEGGGRKKGPEARITGGRGGEGREENIATAPPVFSTWTLRQKDHEQQVAEVGRLRFLPPPSPSPPAFPHDLQSRLDNTRSRQLRDRGQKGGGDGNGKMPFSSSPSPGPLWPVPFSYAFGTVRSPRGQTVRQFWLLNDTVRFVDVGLDRRQPLLANPHWVYAYRVNYDLQNWRMLIDQLHKNCQEVPVMSRMQLIVDAETFLRESAEPQLFVHLLSYLSNEDDLGVLLVGLDALHSLLELFSGSQVFGPLIIHFLPVVRQLDRQLASSSSSSSSSGKNTADPEVAALWLLSPLRLAKLYQLRCAANLGTCTESKQVRKWLAYPTALAADNHQQLAAICQHLFTHAGPSEVALLSGLLKQPHSAAFSTVIRQLGSSCVQDEALVKLAVDEILRTRNAIVYSTSMNNLYTIHYNRKFRELFWTCLAQQLNIHERQILFAVNTGKSDRMARVVLHSVRSLGELNLVQRVVLSEWPESLKVEMEYLRRKLSWAEREASEQIRKYLIRDPTASSSSSSSSSSSPAAKIIS